jgi:hypothetical protein
MLDDEAFNRKALGELTLELNRRQGATSVDLPHQSSEIS